MKSKSLKIACVANFLPRECGIATFTKDLTSALKKNLPKKTDIFVVAINDTGESYNYPDIVKCQINQEYPAGYMAAADFINKSGADICMLQHEFGIFGGANGRFVLYLARKLKIPLVITMHTVLDKPLDNEKLIIQELSEIASKIVVMSTKAINFLTYIYNVPTDKLELIHHGVPDLPFVDHNDFKKELNLEGRKVLMTFGLLSSNKGIEVAIKALPSLVKKHPNLIYLCLGKTHPNVYKQEGDKYLNSLIKLVKENGLENNVRFIDKFMKLNELSQHLLATDIYITPYHNEAQITSGTLAYAVGAGTAIVSTPYWYAADILGEERGKLFNFDDHEGLALILDELLSNDVSLQKLRKNAYSFGRNMTWEAVSKQYYQLQMDILEQAEKNKKKSWYSKSVPIAPTFNLSHLKRLTDNTGMLQHAKFSTPNRLHGYCIDDNARALQVINHYYHLSKDKEAVDLINTYLSFIHYMQSENGQFRNFLEYNRNFIDEAGSSDDAFGRTLWALGDIIANPPSENNMELAKECFIKALKASDTLEHIRGKALSILGIAKYLKKQPEDSIAIATLKKLVDDMMADYAANSSKDWQWFATDLSYDNANLPMAMFAAYKTLPENSKLLKTAIATMQFLEDITFKDGRFSPVGSNGWFVKGSDCATFDQQPLDSAAMLNMYKYAWEITKDKHYLKQIIIVFNWFLGDNHSWTPLYDFETGGCCDGLEQGGTNKNQGAESLLSWLEAQLTIIETFEFENCSWPN